MFIVIVYVWSSSGEEFIVLCIELEGNAGEGAWGNDACEFVREKTKLKIELYSYVPEDLDLDVVVI